MRYRTNGRKVYVVQIIRRKLGNYRDSQTFENRAEAEKWAKKREIEIDLAIAEGRDPRQPQPGKETLGDAIDRYIAEQARIGKTKAQCLRSIRNEYAICEKSCDLINSAHIVEFAKEVARRPNVNSPATVGNYLSHLSAIFNYAPALWGFPLDKAEMNKAIIACKHIGLTGKSVSRERRPTLVKLNRLLTHFAYSTPNQHCVHLPINILSTGTGRVKQSEGGKRGDLKYRSGSRLRGCATINISAGSSLTAARRGTCGKLG